MDERLPMTNAKFDSALARKLSSFVEMSKDELGALVDIQSNRVMIKRGQVFIEEGQTAHKAFFLQSGWGCSFKMLPDGGRQVIRFPIPGDCIGLRSILLRASDHSCSALTDVLVAAVEASRMLEIFNKFPRLGAAFLCSVSQEGAMVVEHLVSIGRRSAKEGLAHFILELTERLKLVGLATETQFEHPLNQSTIADALGLSEVHVNRVLRELREENLLTTSEGEVNILDLSGLRKLAGYRSLAVAQDKVNPTNAGQFSDPDPPPAMPSSV